ncbi:MAG: glutathione peroxidase [Neisseriales bacterium]|nr:MAG: glutathione peroxidase [Neisseriales bacterium]
MADNIYTFKAQDIHGKEFDFEELRGKVVLIVNTASKCGFTGQYRELEELHKKYHADGLEIIGFPCNQFGHQEPGSEQEILEFCNLNYDVSFKLMSKIEVNGNTAHPLYKHLKQKAPGILGSKGIKWNFTKFLINRDSTIITRYPPQLKPSELEIGIQSLLNMK